MANQEIRLAGLADAFPDLRSAIRAVCAADGVLDAAERRLIAEAEAFGAALDQEVDVTRYALSLFRCRLAGRRAGELRAEIETTYGDLPPLEAA